MNRGGERERRGRREKAGQLGFDCNSSHFFQWKREKLST